tara:strand:+ start:545 stop:673 length:129 start_codon:yes stop_codon:yes gene_type:complete
MIYKKNILSIRKTVLIGLDLINIELVKKSIKENLNRINNVFF